MFYSLSAAIEQWYFNESNVASSNHNDIIEMDDVNETWITMQEVVLKHDNSHKQTFLSMFAIHCSMIIQEMQCDVNPHTALSHHSTSF